MTGITHSRRPPHDDVWVVAPKEWREGCVQDQSGHEPANASRGERSSSRQARDQLPTDERRYHQCRCSEDGAHVLAFGFLLRLLSLDERERRGEDRGEGEHGASSSWSEGNRDASCNGRDERTEHKADHEILATDLGHVLGGDTNGRAVGGRQWNTPR